MIINYLVSIKNLNNVESSEYFCFLIKNNFAFIFQEKKAFLVRSKRCLRSLFHTFK